MNNKSIHVLIVTSEWPDNDHPNIVPFLVDQIDSLRQLGITIKVFSFRGSKNPMNYLRAWINLRKIIKNERVDLIHAHFGQSGIIALPKLRPLVVTFHGSDVLGEYSGAGSYSILSPLLRLVSKAVARFSDEIIVVSRKLGQNLTKRRTYHVIPCGVNMEVFKPINQIEARKRLDLPSDKYLVFFPGPKDFPVKRYNLAEKAIALLQDPRVEMLVANSIPHNQMSLYLNACDALILTSKHEGSPTIIKEALSCNLPIVSTDVGDIKERIGRINGCIVCEDDNPLTLSEALRKVLIKGKTYHGRDAAKSVELSLISEKIISVYQQALTKRKNKYY